MIIDLLLALILGHNICQACTDVHQTVVVTVRAHHQVSRSHFMDIDYSLSVQAIHKTHAININQNSSNINTLFHSVREQDICSNAIQQIT